MEDILMCSGISQYATEKNNVLETKTWNQIVSMARDPEAVSKAHAKWVIPSTLSSRRFQEQERLGVYHMLWVDLDKEVPDISIAASIVEAIVGNVEYLIYLTSSATQQNQKCRILVPLVDGLSPKQWRICQELLNNFLENNGLIPDRVNQRFGQLCFLPNKGGYYEYVHNVSDNGQRLAPLEVFEGHFKDLWDQEVQAEIAAQAKIVEAKRKREERLEKGYSSPIEWFNQHYSVEEILMDNGYDQKGSSFRHPESGSGSYSASIDPATGRAHSLSYSDKLYTGGGGIGAHDTFSCFTVLNHDGSMDNAIVEARALKDAHETETLKAILDQISAEQSKPDPDTEMVEKLNRHASSIQNSQDTRGFKLIYADDLLSTPEPLEWLVQDYLPPIGLGFVNGESASGKSFLAIDWCCSIVTGQQWRGNSVAQGGAVILAGEGQFGIKRRLKAWEVDNNVDLSTCPIAVSDIGAAMIDDKSLAEVEIALDDFIDRYGSLSIIVIDTLHRNLGAGDENSAQDMAKYFHNLDCLRVRYDCLIVTVHHTGHGDGSRARGSSSIKAAVDVEYLVKHKKDDGVSTVTCSKMKDGPKAFVFSFKLYSVALPWIGVDGTQESSAVMRVANAPSHEKRARMSNATELIFTQLAKLALSTDNKNEVVGEVDWRKASYTVLTHDNADSKRKAFARAKAELQKLGFIEVMDNNYTIDHGELNARAASIVDEIVYDPFEKSDLLREPDNRTGQDI